MDIKDFFRYKYIIRECVQNLNDALTVEDVNIVFKKLQTTKLAFKLSSNDLVYVWHFVGGEIYYIHFKLNDKGINEVNYFSRPSEKKNIKISKNNIKKYVTDMRRYPNNFNNCRQEMNKLYLKLQNNFEEHEKVFEVNGIILNIHSTYDIIKEDLRLNDNYDMLGETLFSKFIGGSYIADSELHNQFKKLNIKEDYNNVVFKVTDIIYKEPKADNLIKKNMLIVSDENKLKELKLYKY